MPDIAMCKNKTCPSRDQCYRYRAVPARDHQSYMAYEPDEDAGKCEDFVQVFASDQDLAPAESP